jgi:hypothetical protein
MKLLHRKLGFYAGSILQVQSLLLCVTSTKSKAIHLQLQKSKEGSGVFWNLEEPLGLSKQINSLNEFEKKMNSKKK